MLNLNDKNEYIDTIVDADTTPNNTPSTIVQRDANGNFSAGTITANLNGTASNASQLSNMSATNAILRPLLFKEMLTEIFRLER